MEVNTPTSAAIAAYLAKKAELNKSGPIRPRCLKCRKPELTCYCAKLPEIISHPEILILMHPQEEKHPVGTGRMTHQCLRNSRLIVGTRFDHDERIRNILNEPSIYPMVLYPGRNSTNLSKISTDERAALWPAAKKPLVIVIDGTWHHARRMLHHSPNLQALPKLSFDLPRLSKFVVRKQPRQECFSTLEATHEVLRLFGQDHTSMLEAFEEMVAKQLSFRGTGVSRHAGSYLARKARRQKLKEERLRHKC